jgi:hypothetical protein
MNAPITAETRKGFMEKEVIPLSANAKSLLHEYCAVPANLSDGV